jgi:uncharacterized paraquat-inducible protein A
MHGDRFVCARCSAPVDRGTCPACRADRAQQEVRRRLAFLLAALLATMAALAGWNLADLAAA